MLEKLHDQITTELGQSSRTDTIFVVTAIIFNLVILGVNSAMADNASWDPELLDGLIRLYKDNEVDQYYPEELLNAYGARYLLFAAVIVLLGLTAIVVPLIIRYL